MSLAWQLDSECLRVSGDWSLLTLKQAPAMQQWCEAKSLPFTRVNLSEVEKMDSAGLACIASWLVISPQLGLEQVPNFTFDLAQVYGLENVIKKACL